MDRGHRAAALAGGVRLRLRAARSGGEPHRAVPLGYFKRMITAAAAWIRAPAAAAEAAHSARCVAVATAVAAVSERSGFRRQRERVCRSGIGPKQGGHDDALHDPRRYRYGVRFAAGQGFGKIQQYQYGSLAERAGFEPSLWRQNLPCFCATALLATLSE